VIVDPALVMEGGHNYSALLRLKAELSKLDVEHKCLASITADATVRNVAAAALPQKGLWWRSSFTRREFIEHTLAMREQLSLALNDLERPPDLLILPCCDAVQVDAVAGYYSQSSGMPSPHLLIWLLFTPHHYKPADDRSATTQIIEYKDAFTALRNAIGDDRKITIASETAAMAAIYSNIIGLEVRVAPCPNLAASGGRKSRESKAPAVRIATFGHANDAKGYHLLPEAIGRVLGRDRRATFFIHGTFENADSGDGPTIFGALSKLGSRVVTSHDVLPSSEYRSHLLETDLLLLPYDRTTYETRGSGLFNEARQIGIPVAATRGCAFAQPAFAEGWGVEIGERSSVGLAEAILTALQRLPELAVRAEQARRTHQVKDVGAILPTVVTSIDPAERSARATAVKWRREARLLPKTFFTGVSLREGARIRNGESATGSSPASTRAMDGERPIASIVGRRIETTSVPYAYSVVFSVRMRTIRALPAASRIAAQVSVEVFAGTLGITWVDESYGVLDGAERYAPSMGGVQCLVVPGPAHQIYRLVFRNFEPGPEPTSFRIVDLRAKTLEF
jgi:glycosyltransferase involved in cell wall biosynthesis